MLVNPEKFVRENFDNALKSHQIQVYYQPEIRALTGRVCGFEALARWIDPELGVISPADFIPVLEKINRIHELDLYMVREVCKWQAQVRDSGQILTRDSVNLSQRDFDACDIFAEVDKIRREYDSSPKQLNIEITESALTGSSDTLREGMDKFRAAGYHLWMDDFGSGFSSLNNLKDYEFDVLKIDMAFLRDFDKKPKSRIIIAAIVNMAKELGIHTLAEGVETKAQYEFLRKIGCEKLQGFLFGKPEPIAAANDKSTQKDIESPADSKYYRDIGQLNVLSYHPLNHGNPQLEVMNNQALAIIEVMGDKMRYLFANQAYHRYNRSIGYETLERSAETLNTRQDVHDCMFWDLIKKCRMSKRIESMDFVVGGVFVNVKGRHLATNYARGIDTFAFISTNLTEISNLKKSENLNQVIYHLLGIYNRIDLFYEDGTAENIYLETLQGEVTDLKHDATGAIALYTAQYIVPEEQRRFRNFYDMETVAKRARRAKKNHVTGFFHSLDENGEVRLQMYILIPFHVSGRRIVMSCVRDIDGVDQGSIDALQQQLTEVIIPLLTKNYSRGKLDS